MPWRNTYSDEHTDGYADQYTDGLGDRDSDSDADGDGHGDGDGYSDHHGNGDFNPDADVYANGFADTDRCISQSHRDMHDAWESGFAVSVDHHGRGRPDSDRGTAVTFFNLYHVLPDNLDVLLVGPQGQKFVLMGDAGDAVPIDPSAPVTLMFTDAAGQVLPNSSMLTSGMFEPTTWESPVTDFPGTGTSGTVQ